MEILAKVASWLFPVSSDDQDHRRRFAPLLRVTRLERREVLNGAPLPVDPAAAQPVDQNPPPSSGTPQQAVILQVDAAQAANDHQSDLFEISRSGETLSIKVNGEQRATANLSEVSSIHIIGSDDNDRLILDYSNGNPLQGLGVVFEGRGGSDQLVLQGGSANSVDARVDGSGSGSIFIDGVGTEFQEVESVEQTLAAANVAITLQTPGSAYSLQSSSRPGSIDLTTPNQVLSFADPSVSLSVNFQNGTGTAGDSFVLQGLNSAWNASLSLAGDAQDQVQVSGTSDLGAGSLSVTAGTQKIDGSVTSDGGTLAFHAEQTLTLEASGRLHSEGGLVVLDAGPQGTLLDYGQIDVSATEPGMTGGMAQLLGRRVGVGGEATISANGLAGGGTILVGGDYHGDNPDVRNAEQTIVGASTRLTADATENGDGGKVIIWSNDFTNFVGSVTARGGKEGGNGGFVEVSSANSLQSRGTYDLSAPKGQSGTLLFDPLNIQIVGGTSDGSDDTDTSNNELINDAGSNTTGTITFADNGAGSPNPFLIYESEIEGTNADIVLEARNSITTSGTFVGAEVTLDNNRDLTLRTRNSSALSDGDGTINLTGSTDGSALTFRARGSGTITIEAATVGTNKGDIVLGGLRTDADPISVTTNNGTITLQGTINAGAAVTLRSTGAISQTGGSILATTLTAKTLNAAGAGITLTQSGNDATSINLQARNATDTANAAGNISYVDADGIGIAALRTTASASVVAGDNITQTGSIEAGALIAKTLNDSGADITLTNAANAVTSIDLRARNAADTANAAGAISYRDTDGFNVNAIQTTVNATLNAGDTVYDVGGVITADGLQLLGANASYVFGNYHSINKIAANTGLVHIRNSTDLEVGTVNGTVGITTTSNVILGIHQTLTVNQKIDAGANGDVLLGANFFPTPAGTFSVIVNAAVSGRSISILGNDVAINAGGSLTAINVASILPYYFIAVPRPINLGTETPGALSLTAAELARIKVPDLYIGNNSQNAGTSTSSITISDAINLTDVNRLILLAGTSLTATAAGSISVQSLQAYADTGAVTLNNGNDVDYLSGAASAAGQSFQFKDTDGFTVYGPYYTTGISTGAAGTVTLVGGGLIDQLQAIKTGDLTVKTLNNIAGAANIKLDLSTNLVSTIDLRTRNAADTLAVTSQISYRDSDGVDIAAIQTTSSAGVVAGDAITQSGAILAGAFTAKTLKDGGANITLTDAANAVASIDLRTRNAADTAVVNGQIDYRDVDAVQVARIETGKTGTAFARVIAGGLVNQSGKIETQDLVIKTLNDTAKGANIVLSYSVASGTTLLQDSNEVTTADLRTRNAADTAAVNSQITYFDKDAVKFTRIETGTAGLAYVRVVAGDDVTQGAGTNTDLIAIITDQSGKIATQDLAVRTLNDTPRGANIVLDYSVSSGTKTLEDSNEVTRIDLRTRTALNGAAASSQITYFDKDAVQIARIETSPASGIVTPTGLSYTRIVAGGAVTQVQGTNTDLTAIIIDQIGKIRTEDLAVKTLNDTAEAANIVLDYLIPVDLASNQVRSADLRTRDALDLNAVNSQITLYNEDPLKITRIETGMGGNAYARIINGGANQVTIIGAAVTQGAGTNTDLNLVVTGQTGQIQTRDLAITTRSDFAGGANILLNGHFSTATKFIDDSNDPANFSNDVANIDLRTLTKDGLSTVADGEITYYDKNAVKVTRLISGESAKLVAGGNVTQGAGDNPALVTTIPPALAPLIPDQTGTIHTGDLSVQTLKGNSGDPTGANIEFDLAGNAVSTITLETLRATKADNSPVDPTSDSSDTRELNLARANIFYRDLDGYEVRNVMTAQAALITDLGALPATSKGAVALFADGNVSQTLTTDRIRGNSLLLREGTLPGAPVANFVLQSERNDVWILAGATGGIVRYTDGAQADTFDHTVELRIDSVSTSVGGTDYGAIGLQAVQEISIRLQNPTGTLTSGGTLEVNKPVVVSEASPVTDQLLQLTADDVAINNDGTFAFSGMLDVNPNFALQRGIVSIRNETAGRAIDLGTNPVPNVDHWLGLSNAELNLIDAAILRIGRNDGQLPGDVDPQAAGNIAITTQIDLYSPAKVHTLHLLSGGTITEPAGYLEVDTLVVTSYGVVYLAANNNVNYLAGKTLGNGSFFYYQDRDAVAIYEGDKQDIADFGSGQFFVSGINTNDGAVYVSTISSTVSADENLYVLRPIGSWTPTPDYVQLTSDNHILQDVSFGAIHAGSLYAYTAGTAGRIDLRNPANDVDLLEAYSNSSIAYFDSDDLYVFRALAGQNIHIRSGADNISNGDMLVDIISASANGSVVWLESKTGSILDANGANNNIWGTYLQVQAINGGVGSSGDPLDTAVTYLEGDVGPGEGKLGTSGLFVNNIGTLFIGGIPQFEIIPKIANVYVPSTPSPTMTDPDHVTPVTLFKGPAPDFLPTLAPKITKVDAELNPEIEGVHAVGLQADIGINVVSGSLYVFERVEAENGATPGLNDVFLYALDAGQTVEVYSYVLADANANLLADFYVYVAPGGEVLTGLDANLFANGYVFMYGLVDANDDASLQASFLVDVSGSVVAGDNADLGAGVVYVYGSVSAGSNANLLADFYVYVYGSVSAGSDATLTADFFDVEVRGPVSAANNVNMSATNGSILLFDTGLAPDVHAKLGKVTLNAKNAVSFSSPTETTVQSSTGIISEAPPTPKATALTVSGTTQIDPQGNATVDLEFGQPPETNMVVTVDWQGGVTEVFTVNWGATPSVKRESSTAPSSSDRDPVFVGGQTLRFFHRYTAPPNAANPAANIDITFTVTHDANILVNINGIDQNSGTATVNINTGGILAETNIWQDLNPVLEALALRQDTSTEVLVERTPLLPQNVFQDLEQRYLGVSQPQRRIQVLFYVLTPEGDEIQLRKKQSEGSGDGENAFVAGPEILQGDNLERLLEKLPNNRYRIYLQQAGRGERLLLDVFILDHQVVDINELQGDTPFESPPEPLKPTPLDPLKAAPEESSPRSQLPAEERLQDEAFLHGMLLEEQVALQQNATAETSLLSRPATDQQSQSTATVDPVDRALDGLPVSTGQENADSRESPRTAESSADAAAVAPALTLAGALLRQRRKKQGDSGREVEHTSVAGTTSRQLRRLKRRALEICGESRNQV